MTPLQRWGFPVAILLLVTGGMWANCRAAGDVLLGLTVPAAERIPAAQIDHSSWDALLGKYVDAEGMVHYAAWKDTPADVARLDRYIDHLSAASFSQQTPRAARLAYWINAYNAVTIKGILREYPTSSIRNHTARLFGYNIWKNLKLRVAGNAYSLEQIEHEILRKMGEPRIHFAINCASIGCPKLLAEAYVADRLEEQLTANTKDFFADRSKFRYDPTAGVMQVSPILKWFAEDFGDNQAELLRTIAPYLPTAAAQEAARRGNVSLRYLEYDWSLNDQARSRSTGG